jgi:acyl carrier protein
VSATDGIIDTLRRILTEDLELTVDPQRLEDANALLEDDLGVDSVALIELIGAIEAHYGFEFHEADLRTANFRSLATLAEVVRKHTGSEAPAEAS